jgi:hypothetical protein
MVSKTEEGIYFSQFYFILIKSILMLNRDSERHVNVINLLLQFSFLIIQTDGKGQRRFELNSCLKMATSAFGM